jgi:hypothetical protein
METLLKEQAIERGRKLAKKRGPKRQQTYEATPARLGEKDLNPIQIMELYEAAKHQRKTVLLQGELFDLEYSKGRVFYRKHDEILPCGWTSIESLKNQLATMEALSGDPKAN